MQLFAQAVRDGYEEAHILIHSTGGYVGDGVALYNYLVSLPVSITTYNAGQVASAAVLPYLAGKHRVSAETAAFMIHRPYNQMPGGNATTVDAIANSLRIDEDRYSAILRERCTLSEEQRAAFAHNDLTLDTKAAVSAGIVHSSGLFAPPKGAQLFHVPLPVQR